MGILPILMTILVILSVIVGVILLAGYFVDREEDDQ